MFVLLFQTMWFAVVAMIVMGEPKLVGAKDNGFQSLLACESALEELELNLMRDREALNAAPEMKGACINKDGNEGWF